MPAVTSVTNFSDGNVLTATALNAVNCGIHVYSNAAARDAAYGGSGERTLVEGEYAYLLDTNQTLVYSGSSWVSVGATPGLVFLTGASFSAAASVSFPAATFSSTYTNYRCHIQITSASANFTLTGRMRVSGTDNTAANYQSASPGCTVFAGDSNLGNNGSTSFDLKGGSTDGTWVGVFDIMQPEQAEETAIFGQINGYTGVTTFGNAMNMWHNVTSSFDSFSFIAATGTITGYYKVYGYSNV